MLCARVSEEVDLLNGGHMELYIRWIHDIRAEKVFMFLFLQQEVAVIKIQQEKHDTMT